MHPRVLILAVLFSAALLASQSRSARSDVSGFVLEQVYAQRDLPTSIRFAPDGRLFYLELYSGRIMTYKDTLAVEPDVWATLPVMDSGDRGLLSLAFHPQFPDSPYVFIYYTCPDPYANRIVRMTDSAGVGTDCTPLFETAPPNSSTHEGGRLAFGPDSMLYASCGDMYVPANAQDLTTPLGKILRMTTTGQPAPGNPFGPTSLIIAYGVRNSFGLCFDPQSGQGYFTDNGPTCDDELNFLTWPANYGWGPNDPCGGQPPGTTLPMESMTPTPAPTGVCVYRGSRLPYDGNIFFCSYNEGNVRRVVLRPGRPDIADSMSIFVSLGEGALDITEGPDERLWISTTSTIWRIDSVGEPTAVNGATTIAGAAWRIGPSPFTSRVMLAMEGASRLRRIDIVDVSGRRVRSLGGPFSSASSWDGTDEVGRAVPAGVYLVRAETTAGPQFRRLVSLGR